MKSFCDRLSMTKCAYEIESNPDNPAYGVVFNPQLYDLYDKKPFAIRSFGYHVEEDMSAVCPQLDLILSHPGLYRSLT